MSNLVGLNKAGLANTVWSSQIFSSTADVSCCIKPQYKQFASTGTHLPVSTFFCALRDPSLGDVFYAVHKEN